MIFQTYLLFIRWLVVLLANVRLIVSNIDLLSDIFSLFLSGNKRITWKINSLPLLERERGREGGNVRYDAMADDQCGRQQQKQKKRRERARKRDDRRVRIVD